MTSDFTAAFITMFSSVSVLVIVVDFYFAFMSFQQLEDIGKYLGFTCLFAGIVTMAYSLSIRGITYHVISALSSVYFVGIDWMLVSLVFFTYLFTGRHRTKESKCMKKVVIIIAALDSLVLFINIFNEIAVTYEPRNTVIAPFKYGMKPLYYGHLVFTYLMVAFVIYILSVKIAHTPRQYRNQYWYIVVAIAIDVAINALFLYPTGNELYTLLDWSVFGYSVAIVIIYWAAFEYRHKTMLEKLSMNIFQNMNQGMVLFDYSDELIMKNKKAERLFPDMIWDDRLKIDEFLEDTGAQNVQPDEDKYSMQCEEQGTREPLRCDYTKLKNYRGEKTGNLFVFTEPDNSTDFLTGFQNWETFHRFLGENPYSFDHPTTVVIFDILGLGEVNRTFGREVGNQRIRNLVKVMRKNMPKDTFFVRGYEAHLVAICFKKSEHEIYDSVERIRKACGGAVLYGIGMTADPSSVEQDTIATRASSGESRNVLQAVSMASRTLQIKKLLHSGSVHSQTLTSLVRALQESDSDTEEHVKRTQKMGAELGKRIGLSDAEQAELSLLCLLHDIGKIGIPLEILNKPGKLTDREWAVLKTHAEKGYQIAMSSDELKSIANLILHHHERWDGNGYPERLSGHNIPLLSRVIALVDSYDAMVNNRSYRKGLTPEQAQEEIEKCSGTQYDPEIAKEFLDMLRENPEIMFGENTGETSIRVFRQVDIDKVNEKSAGIIGSNAVMGAAGTASEVVASVKVVPYSRYILDLDEHIVEADHMFTEITGFTREEAVGHMSQFDLIAPADKIYYMTQVNSQFASGNIAYLMHDILCKNGERQRVNCIGKRYYDSAAEVYRSEILISRV